MGLAEARWSPTRELSVVFGGYFTDSFPAGKRNAIERFAADRKLCECACHL